MSTPPSEPHRHAGPGSADGPDEDDRRDWAVRPAVPGWGAGQNTYAGPSFDDTGWHIDLSGVDWDQPPEPDYGPDPSRPRDSGRGHRTTLRFRHHGPASGNGGASPGGYREPRPRQGPRPQDGTGGPPARDGYGEPPPPDGYRAPPPQAFSGPPPGRQGYDYAPDAPTERRPRPGSRPGSGRHARPILPGEQPPAGRAGQPATGLRRPPPARGRSGAAPDQCTTARRLWHAATPSGRHCRSRRWATRTRIGLHRQVQRRHGGWHARLPADRFPADHCPVIRPGRGWHWPGLQPVQHPAQRGLLRGYRRRPDQRHRAADRERRQA